MTIIDYLIKSGFTKHESIFISGIMQQKVSYPVMKQQKYPGYPGQTHTLLCPDLLIREELFELKLMLSNI